MRFMLQRFTFLLTRRYSRKPQPAASSTPHARDPIDTGSKLCENEYGSISIAGWQLNIDANTSWGRLLTLLHCPKIYEIFSTRTSTVLSLDGVGRVSLSAPLDIEELILHLVEETGARIDLKKPYTQLEYLGWRIFIQLEPAGQLELVATRVQSIPPLRELANPLLAARILTLLMSPSTIVIAGPPGSGKTTLLNSLTIGAARLWPHLHISVVEPVKELVLPGGWASRMVGDVSALIRLTTRYKRPDLLVVGELLTEDIWSFIEAGRSGVPTISTYHSPNIWKCLRSMADALSLHIPGANEATVLRYIDLFIITRKTYSSGSPSRSIEAVYLSDGQRLLPIYMDTPSPTHIPEEDYISLLPSTTLLGPSDTLYKKLLQALKAEPGKTSYEALPPLPVRDLILASQHGE